MNRIFGTLMAMGLVCLAATSARAADDSAASSASPSKLELVTFGDMNETPSTTKGPFYYQSENELRMRKLARGVANVTLCVGEVPDQMFREVHATSPVTGIVVGAVKGVGRTVERFAIGLWEVATFYHPGTNNYQPYVEPEVVFGEYLH